MPRTPIQRDMTRVRASTGTATALVLAGSGLLAGGADRQERSAAPADAASAVASVMVVMTIKEEGMFRGC